MNKFIYLSLLFCLCFSCKPTKDLICLKDLQNQNLQEGIPVPSVDYKIKESDNLYIDIQTMNPEINMLFNPSKGTGYSSGTSQNYGDLTGQYLNGFIVDKNGEVTMPILGKVKVIDQTIEDAQALIQEKADKYIKDATIKLKLLNYKITIMGEVNNPGVYYNYNDYVTILDALSMANGQTDYSNIENALVMRQTEEGTKNFRLNLKSGVDLMNSPAYYIQPNDVIYIEPDNSKKRQINATTYSLIISTISTLVLTIHYFWQD